MIKRGSVAEVGHVSASDTSNVVEGVTNSCPHLSEHQSVSCELGRWHQNWKVIR